MGEQTKTEYPVNGDAKEKLAYVLDQISQASARSANSPQEVTLQQVLEKILPGCDRGEMTAVALESAKAVKAAFVELLK